MDALNRLTSKTHRGPAGAPDGLRGHEALASDNNIWRVGLPVLSGEKVTLRELKTSDAPSLFTMLTSEEVAKFISPPPASTAGFEQFIGSYLRRRAAGLAVSYAVTLRGFDTAIGVFQIREIEQWFSTAEWGFAIGSPFWGTGLFRESAELLLEFAFERLCVHRLEARAAVYNGRANGALLKIGAVQEGILRKSFVRNGQFLDQVLYAIVEDDWRTSRGIAAPSQLAHVH